MQSRSNTAKRDTLNLRVKPGDRELIDRAATLVGKSRTDFLLDAGRRAAQDALLDRRLWRVDSAAFDAFVALLDAPPQPNERLRRTMKTRAPWE
ncbi:DUF1778 domain-containing protein [Methylocystis parvus]|uniref:DUF1778 domain-containing protein n=1 Tax=Methylocystis parvus TaxID=134 RepID=A0A6B8M2P1_9HYPH|nr:DUF1778 domain-containing protein [Methylocystis parvus]QGM97151.1 DUF1778 domain-containing protein [Methylocystis parvus]WBJ98944.1 DUF1778 domain-containing protein [Methylocystis parvus OBBP]